MVKNALTVLCRNHFLTPTVSFMAFSLAKAFLPAIRAFCKSFIVYVDGDQEVIPFGLKFRAAMGADIRAANDTEVGCNCNDGNGQSDVKPRHVIGLGKPIHTAGSKCENRKKDEGDEFFHCDSFLEGDILSCFVFVVLSDAINILRI